MKTPQHPRRRPRAAALGAPLAASAFLVWTALGAAAGAPRQGGDPEGGQAPPGPPAPPAPPMAAGNAPEDELRQLFVEVERALRRVDDLLFEAGSGDALPPDEVDSGLAELIRESLDRSRDAVQGMDRILEVAQELSQQQQSQGQGQSGRQDGSSRPEDGDGQGQQRQAPTREQEQGREDPADSRLDPSAPQPGQEPPPEPSGRPDGDQESAADPQQQPGPSPADAAGDPSRPPVGADPWGDLPPRVQEVFRTQASDDMPPAYRDWIDAYHRRLSIR